MKPWKTYFNTLFLMLNDISITETKNLRYLALGGLNSTHDYGQCWPILLQESLLKKGIEIQQTDIIAQAGWLSEELQCAVSQQAISQQAKESPYDIVSLMTGMDDQYQYVPIDTFTLQVEELINQSIKLAGNRVSRVLLISIPDWSKSPYGKALAREGDSKEIDKFNSVLQDLAMKYQLTFANITEISRDEGTENFVDDGFQPSKQQYQRWVEEVILPKINKSQGRETDVVNLLP